jgi:small subunit ribosomal protein S9
MTEEPQQPEGEAPEDETPGAPGEPGEATPSETAPEPEEGAPQAEEAPADPEAPGPEIEGLEELGQAAADAGEEPAGEDAPAEEAAGEEAAAEEAAAEEAPAEEAPAEEAPAEEAPAAEAAGEEARAEEAPAEGAAAEEAPRERQRGRRGGGGDQDEVIPGAHLEPDLVLEEQRPEGEYGEYDQYADAEAGPYDEGEGDEAPEPAPVAHTPLELAADARYHATGKRKSAIARVILKPGEGTYTINGRHLDEYFPRIRLQRMASQPLEAAGYHTRMDVVARIHGGGVSAQANALRHGVARALVEADPALRAEMKRRGYLTRDPREKERKKAGLKKARKRPQFSKR